VISSFSAEIVPCPSSCSSPSVVDDFPGGNPGNGLEALRIPPPAIPDATIDPPVFALDRIKEALMAVGVAESLLSLLESDNRVVVLLLLKLEVNSSASKGLRCGDR